MAIAIHPLTPAIGAELEGVDLRYPLGPETVAEIRRALLDRCVVFLRGQEIGPRELRRFCAYFGPVVPSVGRRKTDEVEGVTVLDQVRPVGQGADEWHSDHMFFADPPMGTVLRAVQLPQTGGDTCYVNMAAAFEALSPALQIFLSGLTARNTNERTTARIKHLGLFEHELVDYAAMHPLVRTHRETGRKVLYVSPRDTVRILELRERESDAVLSLLFRHIGSPQFQCRYRWQPGSVAFWDNRAVVHRAIPDYGERRIMHRAMVGDLPAAPQRAR